MSPRQLRVMRILLMVAAMLLVLAAWQIGVLGQFAEPTRIRDALLGQGLRGQVAFVLAYALLQPFGVPGTVFVFAAPLIWPWPIAFALSMLGTMAASVIGFSFARFVARDWLAQRVAVLGFRTPWGPARFARWNDALERNGFATVFWLRLLFWMPQPLHVFFAVSKVPFWTHLWGSLLGYIPPLLATAYLGDKFMNVAKDLSLLGWLGVLAATLLALAATWRMVRWVETRHAPDQR